MRAVFRSALVALSAFLLLGTSGFAQAVDPVSQGIEAYRQGDYAGAMQGHAGLHYSLGSMYARGEGVTKNAAKAVTWFRLAAEQGHAGAQFSLGLMNHRGEGVTKNATEAVRWYLLAAEQGDSGAQHNLGVIYETGEGVPKNAEEAVKWYRLAAEQGIANAQYALGSLYDHGEGVTKNAAEAVNWYRLAAEQGDAFSQFNLGSMYDLGEGVPKNVAEAVRWYRLAAEQGHSKAQFNLGVSYDLGEGVPKNAKEAVKWYRLAAEQGHASAQNNLGSLYDLGEGIPEDYVQAYKWYNLAAAQGQADAVGNRNRLRASLTPAQLAEAQRQSSTAIGSGPEPERRPPAASGDVKATGSAFLVSAIGDLVTNAHVVSECSRLTLADGTLLTLQAYEPASDLALLRSSNLAGRSALPLRSGKGIRLADSVLVAGYPLTGIVSPDLNVTTGNVSALSGPDGNRALFQITAPIQSGNSGGPVLDQAGNLVGVVVSKLDAVLVANITGDLPQNVNFGISLGTLQSFLDAHNVNYRSQQATRELSNASIAEAARSATFQIQCY